MSHWRDKWTGRVSTPDDMVRFVNGVGCCTKVPLPSYPDFPNQVEAMGEHWETTDTWFWKDDLHAEKLLYYTRVFGGKPGFISYAFLPAIVATNGAVADELIFNGVMSPEARELYYIIEQHGPIPIRELKKMLSEDTNRAADRVLNELERQFIITKTGITGRTRATYGFIWDLVERWMPDVLSAADKLGRPTAVTMVQEHLREFGVEPGSPFYVKVLGWK